MKNKLHSITNLINKKITILTIALLILFSTQAQVPTGHYAIFEFTGGSLNNSSVSGNFTGSALATADRFNTAGNAIITSGSLGGVSLGATNFNDATLAFWVKTGGLSANKRVIQMYGDGGNGIQVQLDGTNLIVDLKATASTQSQANYSQAQNVDDNTWHHIAVRNTSIVNGTEIKTEVFLDGVLTSIGGDLNPSGGAIGNFLRNATLIVDPLNSYSGSIDDIYMYKTALTDAEVLQLYNLDPPLSRAYVDIDATGNNDGSSWADAYTDVRTAFIGAAVGSEIWVAEGKYIRQNITNRNAVFGWNSDYVKVYGGFEGNETMLSERDWRANETILSGDIGTLNDASDNCYTVLSGPSGTSANPISYSLIDGFTIQDGNANSGTAGTADRGAGFQLQDYVEEVEIRNCIFTDNVAKYGGGIFASSVTTSDAKLTIEACVFKNNESRYGSALMLVTNGRDFASEVSNSLFYNNETRDFGTEEGGSGVIYVQEQNHYDIDVQLTNLTIANNENNGTVSNNAYGSILYFKHNSSGGTGNLKIDNSIVWGNPGDIKSVARHLGGTNFNSVNIKNMITEENFDVNMANLTTTNIMFQNPLFTDSANNVFTLKSTSPAIDAGSQTGLTIPALDLAGDARVFGPKIDLGCYEQSCAISVTITNSGNDLNATTGFNSYQWSLDGTAISGATSSTYIANASGDYSVEVSDGSCSETASFFHCLSGLISITENDGVLTAPTGFTTYVWYLDAVLLTETSNTLTTSQDGEYDCEVTLDFAGNGTCSQYSNAINICSAVTVSITENNGTLTATAGYSDYQWFKDGVAISSAMNDTYVVKENGNYFCNATENDCTSSSNTIIIAGTSIRNIDFESLKVYPNPTSNIINVNVNETLSSIRIMDLTGKTIKVFNKEAKQLDISEFTTGIYFLEIANTERKSVVKILKR